MDIHLEPKQTIAFTTPATEVLYGGAAGGGKSYLLRVSAIRWCSEVPGIQVYLFRRTLPDLRDNHLRGPTSFHVLLSEHLKAGHVKYRSVENEFEFWNGSILHLCYCDSENDVEKYRGAEIHVLLPDELTHFSEYQYRFLRSRVRIAGLKIHAQYKSRLPRIEAASNPGSIGHAWVKRSFISPKPAGEMWKTPGEEGGMVRQFIPAKLADNPHLTRDDPSYADRLKGLGADNLVRAMLDGDWDIIAGQAFEKLRRDVHAIESFEPPQDWSCFGSFDWGSSKPFSFGLWTVPNGNALPDGRLLRKASIVRFNEVYGWNGKPNEGMRKEASEVAELLRARIGTRKLGYIAADPAMWKVDGGPSIAETFLRSGVVLKRADNSRLTGYVEMRNRIAGDEDGPMLFVTKNCHDGFWRTMPDLVMDENHPEDVDTDQEDHAYDECFVAGTLVATTQGERPIETLRVGDMVLTRFGERPVDAVFSNGIKPVFKVSLSSGRYLTATANHPVWVNGIGYTRVSYLRYGDITSQCAKRSHSAVSITTATRTIQRGIAAFITGTARKAFTAPFTRVCAALCQKAISSIISTGTHSITRSRISPLSLLESIRSAIGVKLLQWIEHAFNAVRSMGWFSPVLATSSARTHVSQHGDVRAVLMTKSARAQSASVISYAASTQSKNSVLSNVQAVVPTSDQSTPTNVFSAVRNALQETSAPCTAAPHVVSVTPAGKAKVYNLSVQGAEEFYAAGVLVHNCRYACMSRPWMSAPQKKKKPVDRWMRAFERDDVDAEDSWKTA